MKKERVLIVDDEVNLCEVLKEALSSEASEVFTTNDPQVTFEVLQKHDIDAVLMDIRLGDVDGLYLLKEILKLKPDTKVILMTAYGLMEDVIEALRGGAYDYITKPFDIERLKVTLRCAINQRHSELERRQLMEQLKVTNAELQQAYFVINTEKNALYHILQISQQMNAILDLRELVNFLVVKIHEFLGCECISLMLFDEVAGVLRIEQAIGLPKEIIKKTRLKVGEGISGWVLEHGQPILIQDINKEPIFRPYKRERYKTNSFIILPLKVKDSAIGVLNVTDKCKDGKYIPLGDDDLKFLTLISNHAAIAIENAKAYDYTLRLAITDPLTELYNRRYFNARLTEEVKRAQRYRRNLSLAIFDVDYFKTYNDTYGHLQGDMLLREFATLLRDNVREVDVICRFGGEEFAVLSPETDSYGVYTLAENLRKKVERHRFGKDEQYAGYITISGGVAQLQDDNMSPWQLIDHADMALYQAKQKGRNTICIYQSK